MVQNTNALTAEERLQQALVPDWEWPYKLPQNWCWTYWGACGNFQAGSAFKNEYQGLTQYKIPFYKVGSLKYSDSNGILYDTSNTVNEEIRNKLKAALIPENSVIFAKIGEAIRINRRSINPVACCIDNNLMSFCAKVCLTKYVYFWSLGIDLYNYTNATTVPAIRKSDLEKVAFPLAPRAEQQRIVDRIESLFAKLDEAKQRVQDALDSLETRKAAILHKAFTGELTAQWRKKHGVGMESWRWIPLKKCGSWHGGGTPSMGHPEYWENGTLLWVTSKDMKSDLIEDTLMHINMLGVENSSANYIEEPAVLFVMRSGILRRTFPVCMVKKPFTVNQDLKALVPTDDINLEYLFWACKANEKQILEKCMKSGTTVESINAAALRDFEIPIAGDNEQAEIVRILGDLLAKEEQAKEAAEGVLEQIDLIKKAILARAFRGELGTNDPSDESAAELLKGYLKSETHTKNRAKSAAIPRKIDSELKSELERRIIRSFYQEDVHILPISTLMEVSSRKLEVIESLRNLEQRGLIKKQSDGNYKFVR